MFTPIPNHVQQAIARLITQYKNAVNIQKFITGIVTPIQDIENELGQMNDLRYLPDATGVQLDVIGVIIGLPRTPGQSDASYIQDLYGQIKINTSEGQPEQVIQLFLLLTSASFVILYEGGLADILLESPYQVIDQADSDNLITILMQAMPAGVRLDGIVSFDPSNAFAYDGSLSGAGYDDGSQTVGGQYPFLWQFNGGGFAYAGDDASGLGYGSLKDPLAGGVYENNLPTVGFFGLEGGSGSIELEGGSGYIELES